MEARKRTRDQAWSIGSWADTVRDVSFNLSLFFFPGVIEQ